MLANEYSDGHALQALRILRDNVVESYENGADAPKARENVHNAATIAGMAFANAFLGVCHSMAHKLGAEFHLAHGLANALLIANVVRYNATDNPTKQTAFSQYDRPQARIRYKEIAEFLGLGQPGDRTEDRVQALVAWIEQTKAALKIPGSIRDAGVNEDEFLAKLDEIAEEAFDDQCTGANPRYPLIAEIKQLLLDSYYGRPYTEDVGHSAKSTPATKGDTTAPSDTTAPAPARLVIEEGLLEPGPILCPRVAAYLEHALGHVERGEVEMAAVLGAAPGGGRLLRLVPRRLRHPERGQHADAAR